MTSYVQNYFRITIMHYKFNSNWEITQYIWKYKIRYYNAINCVRLYIFRTHNKIAESLCVCEFLFNNTSNWVCYIVKEKCFFSYFKIIFFWCDIFNRFNRKIADTIIHKRQTYSGKNVEKNPRRRQACARVSLFFSYF